MSKPNEGSRQVDFTRENGKSISMIERSVTSATRNTDPQDASDHNDATQLSLTIDSTNKTPIDNLINECECPSTHTCGPNTAVSAHRRPQRTMCTKCGQNQRSVVLIPCGHLVLCDLCAWRELQCPVCHSQILRRLRSFQA